MSTNFCLIFIIRIIFSKFLWIAHPRCNPNHSEQYRKNSLHCLDPHNLNYQQCTHILLKMLAEKVKEYFKHWMSSDAWVVISRKFINLSNYLIKLKSPVSGCLDPQASSLVEKRLAWSCGAPARSVHEDRWRTEGRGANGLQLVRAVWPGCQNRGREADKGRHGILFWFCGH